MNSLKVYRDRYQTSGDEEIGDPFEGKIYVNNAQLIIPEKSIIEPCNNQVFQLQMKMILYFVCLGSIRKFINHFVLMKIKRKNG